MEIKELFKNKDGEEGVGITDLINRIVQVLKGDLLSWGKVQSTSTLNNWAGYIDRINKQDLT